VTYLPSRLPRKILQSLEAIIATRIVENTEVDAIKGMAAPESSEDWSDLLKNLETTEAALLPPTEEVNGKFRRFSVAPRLTPHIRHRTKYLDKDIVSEQPFVYTINGRSTGRFAVSLRELARIAELEAENVISGHLQRHDFSRWIINVYDDRELANEVRKLELRHHEDRDVPIFCTQLSSVIEKRYRQLSEAG
jgi:hypothetical protein